MRHRRDQYVADPTARDGTVMAKALGSGAMRGAKAITTASFIAT